MNKDLDKDYQELENELLLIDDEELLPDSEYDNLSDRYCDSCKARLTKQEFEEFEDTCTDCVNEETSGLVFDDPESEL